MIVFDSTLMHAAGENVSGRDRLAINQQFTRSYVKQQVDYVRALGDEVVLAQKDRTQQLLGWYTRVVTSLDEYYRPPRSVSIAVARAEGGRRRPSRRGHRAQLSSYRSIAALSVSRRCTSGSSAP